MRRQLDLFFMALVFFTRIPAPAWARYSEEDFHHSSRYYPVVGVLVGLIGAGLYLGAASFLPPRLAILLSMAGTVLVTGAFHEDGFADLCDGFGGGYTPQRTLEIMKDSRLGAFGAIGVFFMLAVKWCALCHLPPERLLGALVVAHALSRASSGTLIFSLRYVQSDAESKAKPIACEMSLPDLILCVATGVVPLFAIYGLRGWLVLGVCCAVTALSARILVQRLGGFTGDCLGAVQQLSEVAIYLVLANTAYAVC
ncbi:MAG: adenosylcobinamide-GDP ribazoletransferase [Lentisphaeria bacterium]|nr:adenosylcobinamide-GDP ribazoletransferase [Lentisphaeria bacterium]